MNFPLIQAFDQLGQWLQEDINEELELALLQAQTENPWFTPTNVRQALAAMRQQFFPRDLILAWLQSYPGVPTSKPKSIGLITAGNLPAVGFHDLMCILLSGHNALVKLSEKDMVIPRLLIKKLLYWDETLRTRIHLVDRLTGFDAVIATGSNHSARYFHQYFDKYPHLIRKNRNAVAVLDGSENEAQLYELGKDIFGFFGLGCRNVSKLYVPAGYAFEDLLHVLNRFQRVMLHSKYRNNYEYNFATMVINREPYMKNECILLLESDDISSRIATLHYTYYQSEEELQSILNREQAKIQCIVSDGFRGNLPYVTFGDAQSPTLGSYADGIDTMQFLSKLDEL